MKEEPNPATDEQHYCLPDELVDKMNPKHTATGEWTEESVLKLWHLADADKRIKAIAEAHNAELADWVSVTKMALAAETAKREGIEQRLGVAFDRMVADYQQQLTAERETVKNLRIEAQQYKRQIDRNEQS